VQSLERASLVSISVPSHVSLGLPDGIFSVILIFVVGSGDAGIRRLLSYRCVCVVFVFLEIHFSLVKDKVGKMFFISHICMFPLCVFIKPTISDSHCPECKA
jgi:uncharacterized membrane protein